MNHTYEFSSEPRGATWRALIDRAVEVCQSFQVIIPPFKVEHEAQLELLAEFAPFQLGRYRVDEWPGTRLLDETAILLRFRLNRDSADLLKESLGGPFHLGHLNAPEDLAFLREDGSVWFASVTHESMAWLELSPTEAPEILMALPEVKLASSS